MAGHLLFSLHPESSLSQRLIRETGVSLSPCKVNHFADGETFCKPLVSVRDMNCFVLQSTCSPVNENLMELLIFIDALKMNGAASITIFVPYFGYSRQDRIVNEGDPITAQLVAHLIERAGADRIITIDIHNLHIPAFFSIPVINLSPLNLFGTYFRERLAVANIPFENVCVVSPDRGSANRAKLFSGLIPGSSVAIADKFRPAPNVAEVKSIDGEVAGKTCIIIDDMIDTGGTIRSVVELLKENKATSIMVGATHGIFSNNAVEKLRASGVSSIVVSDTLENVNPGVEAISVSPIISDLLRKYVL